MFIWYSRGIVAFRWEIRMGLPKVGGMPADGWLEVIGYGDGGGSRKYT